MTVLDDFLLSHTADADKFFFFTTKGKHMHSDLQYPEDAYLFFGKETKGLPEWLLHEHPDVLRKASDAQRFARAKLKPFQYGSGCRV